MKRILLVLVLLFGLCVSAGCSSSEVDTMTEKETDVKTEETEKESEMEPESETEKSGETEEIVLESTGSPEKDSDLGLRNIKVDSSREDLTEEQKAVLQYFDNDYFEVVEYEFLQRYPQIYEGAQLKLNGIVKKVISSDADEYKMLVWIGKDEGEFYLRNSDYEQYPYEQYVEDNKNNLVVIKGSQTEARLIEGDEVAIYGRYREVGNVEVDGTSYTLPVIDVYQAFLWSGGGTPVRYDTSFIKQVAKTIFGDNIEIRNSVYGEDYELNYIEPFLVCELDNQSNAKFTKYRFYTTIGLIEDARGGFYGYGGAEGDTIQRIIEFAPDFEHFFLFIFDTDLNTLTLEYYDTELNKIWGREFEETQNAQYDYTQNNIYLVANNDFYVINTQTGEDTYTPNYVGAKREIRKLEDGILLFSEEVSDAIMKTDLEGNIIWKTNIGGDLGFTYFYGIQLIGDYIVVGCQTLDIHYFCFDVQTGELVIDAIANQESTRVSDYQDNTVAEEVNKEDEVITYGNYVYDPATYDSSDWDGMTEWEYHGYTFEEYIDLINSQVDDSWDD